MHAPHMQVGGIQGAPVTGFSWLHGITKLCVQPYVSPSFDEKAHLFGVWVHLIGPPLQLLLTTTKTYAFSSHILVPVV